MLAFQSSVAEGRRESEVVVVVCDADSGSEVCSKESWGKVGLCIPRSLDVSPTCAAPGHCQWSQSVQSLRAGCEAEAHDQLEGPTHAHSDIGAGGGTQIEDTQGHRRPQSTSSRYTVLHVSKPHVLPCWGALGEAAGGIREWVGPVLPDCQRGATGRAGRANLHYPFNCDGVSFLPSNFLPAVLRDLLMQCHFCC